MLDYKTLLALLGILLGTSSYIAYILSIYRHGVRPHAFSWLVWGLLMGISFTIQFTQHAGAGSWLMGLGACACLLIFSLALIKGNRAFGRFDWACLFLALMGIVLWITTNKPVTAAVMITIADAVGYAPTFKKGFRLPREENIAPYTVGIVTTLLSIFALSNYSVATWLYPASLAVTNTAFISMILLRRRQLPLTTIRTAR
jgi:hypothetical protein